MARMKHILHKKLKSMVINDEIDKDSTIEELYFRVDYYTKRSFDVTLCRLKKELQPMVFISNTNNVIKRIA